MSNDKQNNFELLAKEFELKPSDYYFLDLIPLIEMIWADGENQPAELALLYHFTIEHIAHLDRAAGIPLITTEDANDFLERFAHRRPPQRLLDALSELVLDSASSADSERNRSILKYCMDIAAACTTQYPYALRGRIVDSEKVLLDKLFAAFQNRHYFDAN
ncbi:hypothetical protein [Methylotuvimicrobium alcaliphilum]|uniref:Uncharacterized protein n=1 Tax=Methylotuvimicrobium alcaliphilum (strain DSM 19304 / NCIMB 14124 / VKM B-2133 / 20Z) TaxID=1091494 RepID=G4T3P5_META2|nr:hypothetical protein [Methylotuvimicrobium alcaliphilum]CCE24851.1 conserved protein of unknown function [Methylotuvimicrobium alcaliphilum 20Z]